MRFATALVTLTLLASGCAPDCEEGGILCTVAGVLGANGYLGDGPATETWLYFPSSLAHGDGDAILVDDFNNMRIRALDQGELTTVFGNGIHGYATPGAPILDSPLENPVDIVVTPDGALLVAELHSGRILTDTPDGKVDVVAGSGDIGYAGDGGPATEASLSQAAGIALASDGTLFVADTENHAIRRVDAVTGVITTLAGTPEQSGFADGVPGAFRDPIKIRYLDGTLYVADSGNHAIRTVDAVTGEVATLAGDGTEGYAGDGGPASEARLSQPYGVRPLDGGAVLVADSGNAVVRYIAPDGTISTLVGTGEPGRLGDGKPVLEAQLDFPSDMLPDGEGGLFITDMRNGAVRRAWGILP